jgi:rubrerythrin
MEMRDRISAIEMAISNEAREQEFYLANAMRTKHPLGKSTFKALAEEELEHLERLRQLYQELSQEGRWPETVPLTVGQTNIKEVLASFVQENLEATAGDEDDLAAIRKAMEFEAQAAKFYVEVRELVEDPKEKEFFDLLARIEREHYLALSSVEELLSGQRSEPPCPE